MQRFGEVAFVESEPVGEAANLLLKGIEALGIQFIPDPLGAVEQLLVIALPGGGLHVEAFHLLLFVEQVLVDPIEVF